MISLFAIAYLYFIGLYAVCAATNAINPTVPWSRMDVTIAMTWPVSIPAIVIYVIWTETYL